MSMEKLPEEKEIPIITPETEKLGANNIVEDWLGRVTEASIEEHKKEIPKRYPNLFKDGNGKPEDTK